MTSATIVDRALADTERGLGKSDVRHRRKMRAALLVTSCKRRRARRTQRARVCRVHRAPRRDGARTIDAALVREAMQHRGSQYDKGGDMHYDIVSAFIKSIRASDPDAALYWLARMIDGGEDPLFIVRRLVILASEDVGLADSAGWQIAIAAQQAVHFVGMPEGFYPLAHATLYLGDRSEKQRASDARIGAAMEDVRETRNDPVPHALAQRADAVDARARLRRGIPLRPRRLLGDAAQFAAGARRASLLQKKAARVISRTASFPLLLLGVCVGASHKPDNRASIL